MKTLKTVLYWIISWTWGLPMTLFGAILALFCLITRHKPCRYKQAIYFQAFGDYWGGMEAGCFFFVDRHTTAHTCQHEWGHGVQNLVLGPLMPFVVCIPSASRYWLRNCKTQRGKKAFSVFMPLVLMVIPIAFIVSGILSAVMFLVIVGCILAAYIVGLSCWLLLVETPRYKDGAKPAYDSIWFEGMATKIGEKFYKEGDYVKQDVYF